VWFLSLESFAEVLSDRNQKLLKTVAEGEPESLTELAEISGWAKSNLSRTLHTPEQYDLVRLDKSLERQGCSSSSVFRDHVGYADLIRYSGLIHILPDSECAM